MKTKYYCPRCKGNQIYEYEDSFDCMTCKDNIGKPLEFDKDLFEQIKDKDSLLSVPEILDFIKIFKEYKDD